VQHSCDAPLIDGYYEEPPSGSSRVGSGFKNATHEQGPTANKQMNEMRRNECHSSL
jgi:hypothetical protein